MSDVSQLHSYELRHYRLCCRCGVEMLANNANTCITCLSMEVDITSHIDTQITINFCPKCERYLNPPAQWIHARLESPELLALCLRRVRGLAKRLTIRDARFIWTEPNSRRIKIEITVQGELPSGDKVEQELPLEFLVHCQQCHDCTRSDAKDYWNACVQLRQRTEHKRTLLALEQSILKTKAHVACSQVKQVADGIDFYFNARSKALAFVNFLSKRAPCRHQLSQHLKSHDTHNNTYNYKYTFSVEVAPVCKNDIVCLSKQQSQRLGGINRLCVVYKVSDAIYLVDPVTCHGVRIDSASYFASPFTAIASSNHLTSFMVVEIEHDHQKQTTAPANHHLPLSAYVMRLDQSSCDGDGEAPMVHTRSHLGRLLHEGDTVLGIDLRSCNINHPEFEQLQSDKIPDVILLSKPRNLNGNNVGSTLDSASIVSTSSNWDLDRSETPCFADSDLEEEEMDDGTVNGDDVESMIDDEGQEDEYFDCQSNEPMDAVSNA